MSNRGTKSDALFLLQADDYANEIKYKNKEQNRLSIGKNCIIKIFLICINIFDAVNQVLTNDSKKFIKVDEGDDSKSSSPHCYSLQTNEEIKCKKRKMYQKSKERRPVKEDGDGYTATRQKAATTE